MIEASVVDENVQLATRSCRDLRNGRLDLLWRRDVHFECCDAESLELCHFGRVARRGKDLQAAVVELAREGITNSAEAAACDEDRLLDGHCCVGVKMRQCLLRRGC